MFESELFIDYHLKAGLHMKKHLECWTWMTSPSQFPQSWMGRPYRTSVSCLIMILFAPWTPLTPTFWVQWCTSLPWKTPMTCEFPSLCKRLPEGKSPWNPIQPPFSYGFLWFSYGFLMVFLWFSYGFFLWVSYGFQHVSTCFKPPFVGGVRTHTSESS